MIVRALLLMALVSTVACSPEFSESYRDDRVRLYYEAAVHLDRCLGEQAQCALDPKYDHQLLGGVELNFSHYIHCRSSVALVAELQSETSTDLIYRCSGSELDAEIRIRMWTEEVDVEHGPEVTINFYSSDQSIGIGEATTAYRPG